MCTERSGTRYKYALSHICNTLFSFCVYICIIKVHWFKEQGALWNHVGVGIARSIFFLSLDFDFSIIPTEESVPLWNCKYEMDEWMKFLFLIA